MNNATWACFDCRSTVRRLAYTREAVPCPSCGVACRYLGHKLRMPTKRNTKAWKELLLAIQEEAIYQNEWQKHLHLSRIRELRTEIARLKSKGPNKGREKQIRLYERQLEEI